MRYVLDKDLMHWGAIVEETEQNTNKFQTKIDSFLKEQKSRLESMLTPDALSIKLAPRIQRLPILSSQDKNGKIDFDWPPEAQLEALAVFRKDMVKLIKLEIWY